MTKPGSDEYLKELCNKAVQQILDKLGPKIGRHKLLNSQEVELLTGRSFALPDQAVERILAEDGSGIPQIRQVFVSIPCPDGRDAIWSSVDMTPLHTTFKEELEKPGARSELLDRTLVLGADLSPATATAVLDSIKRACASCGALAGPDVKLLACSKKQISPMMAIQRLAAAS
ncbi:hypothetical protein WJX72_001511 [[Myrmecia] bisecta]|uniref:Uncharacterized protein n=1 Tax=[Myrmecia] bisecta TaxID=41462 RepID=A0AAW1R5B9_9CHLO